MFGSAILEVAIGIIFIYLLIAIICSSIREGIESILKTRAAFLEYGIRQLLHDESGTGLAKSFFNHPLIYSLFAQDYKGPTFEGKPKFLARGGSLPSYIPARNFAVALMDIAVRGPATNAHSASDESPIVTVDSIRSTILNIGNPSVQRALLSALDSAQGNLEKATLNIQAWYDSGMDRVSGWYKRATQRILFGVGFALAIGLNVNTLTLANYLYRDDAARAVLVAQAEVAARDSTLLNSPSLGAANQTLNSLNLPIGWGNGLGTTTQKWGDLAATPGTRIWLFILAPFLGWLLTALAAAMGAPFWFDMLNKVMVIRSTVKPHEKSPEESSEDRQKDKKVASSATINVTPTPPQPPPPEAAAPQEPALTLAPALVMAGTGADEDGCDADMSGDSTADEDLPPSRGGVA